MRQVVNWLRHSKISLLRILPALFVGFIPFNLFNEEMLKVNYRLRGVVEPQSGHKVIISQSREDLTRLLGLVERLDIPECWVITTEKITAPNCEAIDLRGKYTLPAIENGHATLFYGPLAVFHPINAGQALAKGTQALAATHTVIILDDSYGPRLPIDTPIGPLNQGEIALNVALNRIEGHSSRVLPTSLRYLVAITMGVVTAALLYTYPISLTLILAPVLGGLEFVISFLLFESFGFEFSVVASWATMLAMILLGMGDRLDRRERREWRIERDAENLKTLDEMRNNFLSLVSHDLKTPIAKILSLLDRFAGGEFGNVAPQQRETLERIVSASGYLQRTISTLLLLSRIESRDFRIQRVPTDLNEVLEEAIRQKETPARERDIRIEKELEPLFLVDLDRQLISQVMNNLIDNALKYSPTNRAIFVRSGETENSAELSPPQPALWFEIQDEGPGIPLQDRQRVVLKFVRGSNESTASDQSVTGTGLGLYLSKFFVEKHGGRLSLVSKTATEELAPSDPATGYFSATQSGTVIRVTLPLEAPPIEVG